jgi:hypothetical protein
LLGVSDRVACAMLWGMEIELADAVAAVRDELMCAAGRGAGEQLGFVVGPIEVEFTVELRQDASVKVGFKAWVLSADAQAGVSRGHTHRVKMTLTPRRLDGTDLLVSGADDRPAGPGDVSAHVGR